MFSLGGPFGIENAVRYGGAYYSLLGFIVFPFIFSVPEALMTAELGSAFPEAGGSVAWIEEAFGKNWGIFGGYLSWVSGATDNAIYPSLFLGYLISALNSEGNADAGENENDDSVDLGGDWRFFVLASCSIFLAYLNYRGL